MAPAKRVSRRSKRVASDEEQEEQEETIDQPVARPAQRKRERRKKSTARDEDDENDDPNEEDEEQAERFNPKDFKNQPLEDRVAGLKLANFVKEWDVIGDQFAGAYTAMGSAAAIVAECVQEDDKKTLEAVDEAMRRLIDAEIELKTQQAVLSSLRDQVRDEEVDNIEERYEKALKIELNGYRNLTARKKYSKSQPYTEFRNSVWEVEHDGEAMPPLKELIDKEDGEESSDDDEIEVGGATQDFKCPLTMQPFKNPLTSKLCKHSFSGEAIRDYLKQSGGKAACPASGCAKKISLADLVADAQLAKRTRAALRRQKHREMEEEDNDEDMLVD